MRKPTVTAKAIADLVAALDNDELHELTAGEHRLLIRGFLGRLVQSRLESEKREFFSPLADLEVPVRLRPVIGTWRSLAIQLEYSGIVAWKVRAGFDLRTREFDLSWPRHSGSRRRVVELENIATTINSIVFWVPRLVPNSLGKETDQLKGVLALLHQSFSLPNHHLSGFGGAELIAGLILAHFKRTGERVPLHGKWVFLLFALVRPFTGPF